MKLPGTPSLSFEPTFQNLAIVSKFDGSVIIQKADIPETVAALLAVAFAEKVSREEIRECCEAVGVELDKL